MVVGCGRGNGKVVAFVSVPFGINPVQGEGQNGENIGNDGGFGPGCVNFTGGYIFNVIAEWDKIVGSAAVCRGR